MATLPVKRILPHWKLYLLTAPPHLARRCWFSIPASAGCRYIKRFGSCCRISTIYTLSTTWRSPTVRSPKSLSLGACWRLSEQCSSGILWRLSSLPVTLPAPSPCRPCASVSVSRSWAWCPPSPAARLTVNGIVGLLATRGTVQRSYTHELISRFATDCKIELLGSSELVELAEAAAR